MVSPTEGDDREKLAEEGREDLGRSVEVGQDRKLTGRQLVQRSEENRTSSVAGEDLSELRLLLRICVE